jgi:alkylation response protein AidB-like acyl-CoA dehydrogenase
VTDPRLRAVLDDLAVESDWLDGPVSPLDEAGWRTPTPASSWVASAEAVCRAADRAVQTLGGNGLTVEYGVASLLAASRLSRIAPVSREMIVNFVSSFSLGLHKSY